MKQSLVTLLFKTKSYPVNLAIEIGLENACALYELLQANGFNTIRHCDASVRLSEIGIRDTNLVLERLVENKALIATDGGFYKVSLEWLEKDEELELSNINPSFFLDKEFCSLILAYKNLLIKKGRKDIKINEIKNLFREKSKSQSIRALQYSISNNFSSLYFNSKDEDDEINRRGNGGSSKGNKPNNGAWSNGGSKNTVGETGKGDREEKPKLRSGFRSIGEEDI